MTSYRKDPKIMPNKFKFICKGCDKLIAKGQDIVYFPLSKEAKCLSCGQKDFQAFVESAIDEDFYNSQY